MIQHVEQYIQKKENLKEFPEAGNKITQIIKQPFPKDNENKQT
jgi:hypothetical protein